MIPQFNSLIFFIFFLQIKNRNLYKDTLSIGFNYVIITTNLTKNMGWLATAKSQTGVS